MDDTRKYRSEISNLATNLEQLNTVLPPPMTMPNRTPASTTDFIFAGHAADNLAVDAVGIRPHERLAGKLEQHTAVRLATTSGPLTCAITSAAKSVDFFSMPSPTSNRTSARRAAPLPLSS